MTSHCLLGWLQEVSETAERVRSGIEDGVLGEFPYNMIPKLQVMHDALVAYETDCLLHPEKQRDPGPSQEQRL